MILTLTIILICVILYGIIITIYYYRRTTDLLDEVKHERRAYNYEYQLKNQYHDTVDRLTLELEDHQRKRHKANIKVGAMFYIPDDVWFLEELRGKKCVITEVYDPVMVSDGKTYYFQHKVIDGNGVFINDKTWWSTTVSMNKYIWLSDQYRHNFI